MSTWNVSMNRFNYVSSWVIAHIEAYLSLDYFIVFCYLNTVLVIFIGEFGVQTLLVFLILSFSVQEHSVKFIRQAYACFPKDLAR